MVHYSLQPQMVPQSSRITDSRGHSRIIQHEIPCTNGKHRRYQKEVPRRKRRDEERQVVHVGVRPLAALALDPLATSRMP